ncbi:VanZ family protein [Bhargavaea ginsengi]|nr:VanZ family protein [Bhargavaea ginsengi]
MPQLDSEGNACRPAAVGGVEAVLYFLVRTTDADDVILNTFGPLIG